MEWMIWNLPITIVTLVMICYLQNTMGGVKTTFTNIKCNTMDKNWADFRYCRLKAVRRGIISLSLHVELYQVPANNITVNLSLWKKANGYRPFLYNMTQDFCIFMGFPKRYPFLKIFFDIARNNSNINHSCPYDHDIIITSLVMKNSHLNLMPLPLDEYMFQLLVGAYNKWRVKLGVYFERTETFP